MPSISRRRSAAVSEPGDRNGPVSAGCCARTARAPARPGARVLFARRRRHFYRTGHGIRQRDTALRDRETTDSHHSPLR